MNLEDFHPLVIDGAPLH